MSIRVPHLRRLGGAAAAVAALAAVTLSASPAAAAGDGYVRLAHLSPGHPGGRRLPEVRVRRGRRSRRSPASRTARMSRVSAAARPAPTRWRCARPAPTPSTKPVLTTQVTVENGAAYTVAGVGRYADLGLRVLQDDLKLPGPGESKVRIIQASVRAPVLDVDVNNGPEIADGVQFATTTDYREVKPGTWTVKVQPSGGGKSSTLPCTLGARQRLFAARPGRQGRRPEDRVARRRRPAGHRAAGRRGHRRRRHPARPRRCRWRCSSRASRRC